MTNTEVDPAVMAEVLTRQDSYADIHRGDGVRWSCFQIWKLTLGCADCGYRKHPDALELDHVPELCAIYGPKRFNIGGGTGYGLPEFIGELQKCEVVCANCHRFRTWKRKRAVAMVPPTEPDGSWSKVPWDELTPAMIEARRAVGWLSTTSPLSASPPTAP